MSSGSTSKREAPDRIEAMLGNLSPTLDVSATQAALEVIDNLLERTSPPTSSLSIESEAEPSQSPCWRTLYPEYVKKKRQCSPKDETRWLKAESIYAAVFADKPIEEITTEDIDAVAAALKKSERTARTIRGHLFNLRSFFKWAMAEHKTRWNPCEFVDIPKAHQERDGRPLSHEEARRLLHACQEPVFRTVKYRDGTNENQVRPPPEYLPVAVQIALQTGLRKGNVLRLTWKEVDLSAGKILIRGSDMKAKHPLTVPVHPELLEVLRERHGRVRPKPEVRVLGTQIKDLKRSYATALKVAGLDGHHFHDLRHTFCSWLGDEGVSWPVVKTLMGHTMKGADITLRYSRSSWNALTEAVGKLPYLLSDGPPEKNPASEGIARLKVQRREGKEPFHADGKDAGFDLLSFWQWGASDLAGNGAIRGVLAEYLVARALDLAADGARDARGRLDLKTKTGIRVEVKSAAHLQREDDNKLPTIEILNDRSGSPEEGSDTRRKEARRRGDAYIFAVLVPPAKKDVDPLNITQWRFYVVRASVISTKTRSQQSISLATLERLAKRWVAYEGLPDAVESTSR